jgi:hypothetical protein
VRTRSVTNKRIFLLQFETRLHSSRKKGLNRKKMYVKLSGLKIKSLKFLLFSINKGRTSFNLIKLFFLCV